MENESCASRDARILDTADHVILGPVHAFCEREEWGMETINAAICRRQGRCLMTETLDQHKSSFAIWTRMKSQELLYLFA